MKSYQHILVPIDGSDHSKQALQHAIDIARITGGAITLLSVAIWPISSTSLGKWKIRAN